MDRKRGGRVLAGLLALSILFFVGRTCESEHAAVTLVFSLNSSANSSAVSSAVLADGDDWPASFEASLLSGDEMVGTFFHTIDAVKIDAVKTDAAKPASSAPGQATKKKNISKKEVGRWELNLDSGRYRLEIDVVFSSGRTQKQVREIEAVPRGTIHVLLAPRD